MGHIIVSKSLKDHLLKLYEIATADSKIKSVEMKKLYDFAKLRGIDEKNLNKILLAHSPIQNSLPETLNEKVEFMYDLSKVIWSEGEIDANKRYALERYIQHFGFKDENVVLLADFFLEAVQDGISKEEILQKINA